MQLTNFLGLCVVALASYAAAMPHLAGPYHGSRISVQVPTNSTFAHNATTTGTHVKKPLTTGLSKANNQTTIRHVSLIKHVPNHVKHINHCNELCSLMAQTCSIAMPEDDEYCWQTYLHCKERCVPGDFE
ncbi:uncharacterized protein N7498_005386 [Penicillium cinerascens]|uniref:Uncharacterized protein n=1 Tax=Penicillium cinerascens TaxID=70096 RepID=A0A9W9MNC2_9EURO|nr:uncharacterized protein N7498_005386 [Penicillium cinerascens]KAJ5204507.1 hypothetical protein N7498_005386 [Penicillium cinerascens]